MTKKEKQKLQEQTDAQQEREREERIASTLADPDRMDPRLAIERCRCGHKRLLHFDAAWGLAKGHGACAACDCRKFTWTSSK